MSKKITITKKQVLNAIKTEPLVRGQWVTSADEQGLLMSGVGQKPITEVTACKVCAVGGLLRSKLAKSDPDMTFLKFKELVSDAVLCNGRVGGRVTGDATSLQAHIKEVREQLKGRSYLRALSNRFEYLARFYPMAKVRTLLARWVKRNMPAKFSANINDELAA